MNQAEDLKKQIRVERARDVYCAGNAASFYSPGRRLQVYLFGVNFPMNRLVKV